MKFYVGLHQPSDARHFASCFISINRLRTRAVPVKSSDWIMDSGAFRELEQFGGYRHTPAEYAAEIDRIAALNPGLKVVVSQDYMCEPFMLAKTGLTLADHQRLTIERYDALAQLIRARIYLMPVLQGYAPQDYVNHIDQYTLFRLASEAYVGVGSVCKRNGDVKQIEAILTAIKSEWPDLRLHGFGLKTTALASARVRNLLASADSMAWSYAARRQRPGSQNNWREAVDFVHKIEGYNAQ